MSEHLESARKYIEKRSENASRADGLPTRFWEPLIMSGIKIDLIEPGRVLCSMKIPQRLINAGNALHGGVTATLVDLVGSAAISSSGAPVGVSVEINVSYLDAAYANEEIEIEARTLRIGKAVGVVSVELRKKKTGKLFAQGRHTMYLAVSSKM
ncbi:acyl-coenzyme A thioesterase 13 [Neltuma alba]|uniref:acyl-coenzyme A thioesterase 13 n=1 Tax=Neltuma alba TaxID=207710 RepID=UPI0010A3A3B3|nr:acyl-coenzyme A thioesterase 13-like [Prosopis alba]